MAVYVLASANRDKAREIAEILAADVELLPRPADAAEVEETGETLLDNARLKARALAQATGLPAIADDTGLEVMALGGAPGVHTARFAGEKASYTANVRKLLDELQGKADRRACFRTIAIAIWPDGSELIAEGAVHGTIAEAPRGRGGFGYDPVFVPDEGDGRSFAELVDESADTKHRLSHRGRALRGLAEQLRARSSSPAGH